MKHVNILWLWDRLDNLGGVETLLLNFAKNLDRKKFDIYLGVFKNGYVAKYFEEIGVKVIEIKRGHKFDVQPLLKLVKIIREFKIDIIHTHGHFPGIVGRIAGKYTGKKVISTYHLALHEDSHPCITRIITKLTLPLADFVTFVSKGVEMSFYNDSEVLELVDIKKRKHFTIYNGIDLDYISKTNQDVNYTDIRKKYSVSNDEVFLLNVGRLTEQKGQKYLIDALDKVIKIIPNVKILIFGQGELESKLKKRISDLKLDEKIKIFPPTLEILNVMAGCDIFVLPSLYEGFVLVLLETMYIGKPIIATNITGVN